MTTWLYVAIDQEGTRINGDLEAHSQDKALKWLHAKGWTVVRLDQVRPKHPIWLLFEPIKPSLLALFIRELATMLSSGVHLTRALTVMTAHPGPPRFRRAVRQLLADVKSGYSLTQAMMRAPEMFSTFIVGSARVGEASGKLPETLDACASYLEKEYEYSLRLRNALIYPTVLLSACGLLMWFIFSFMVPNFVSLFTDLNMSLPGPTRMLLYASRIVEQYGLLFLATGLGPGLAATWMFYRWARTPGGQWTLERWLLRMPWYGRQVRHRMMARYFRSLGTLVASGVRIGSSLDLLSRSLDREILKRSARVQLQAVQEGLSVAQGMRMTGFFPSIALELITIGEEAGQLDRMLARLATFFDEEMARGLETISKLVEPLVLLILGGFVGYVLLAAFLPIYQLAGSF